MSEAAYAAGVLDCDGSMGVYFSGRSMQAIVVVGVLDPRLPLWLAERWGGKVRVVKPTRPRHRTMYRWELVGRKAAAFVADVREHLVIKREQADLFVRIGETITPNHLRVTPETQALRRELAQQLRDLK